jgi:hypothetical protein
MPNVKRVRQDQEAAAKRYGEYANLVENYNAQVGQVNSANQAAADLYNQQAAEYNRFVDSVKAGGYGLAPVDGGRYASVHGDVGKGIIEYTYRDEKGAPYDASAIYNDLKSLQDAGGAMGYVRNSDGTVTLYQNQGSLMNKVTGVGKSDWQPVGVPNRVMEFTAKPPTQQELNVAQPAEPKPWNPSRRDIAELQNPTVDAAGGQLAAAAGAYANTGILAEANNRSPILANPEEEPLTPSSSGILARVRAGEF